MCRLHHSLEWYTSVTSGGDPGGVLVSGHPQDLSKGVSRNGGTPQDLATLTVILVDLGNESTLRR